MIISLNEHNPVELSQLCNTSENDAQKSSSDINQQEVELANDQCLSLSKSHTKVY